MNTQVDQLLDEALQLPVADRSALVAVLLDSLDGSDDASIPDAWRTEIARRRAGLRDGSISPVPWAEARARLARL
jgi:putative addiction module component (TIGR02574 family)